ncbi:MAG: T9SS type A sorting domain-containing protein, partial [Lentimicrobium sp.]|nr:T9SS type A sorting domain-containing protein [Lentimicrobium sp.]
GEIKYFARVVIRIETRETSRGLSALKNLSPAASVKKSCLRSAQNPDAVSTYPDRRRSITDYQILIITPQSFAGQLDELAQLYLPRGMKTQVATTEFIQANASGADLPEKMRNYIIEQYQQNAVEHVVLAGDVEHVPYRGFYCHVQSSSVYEDNNIPSDIYFSALDGNWNTNGNNLWGEIGEDDLLPEISVGRMSFSNSTELAAMLNKTTKYQNEPVLGELRNPLLAGENLYTGPDTWGSDYLELLIGTRDDNGYTTTGIPEDHNFVRLYDEVSEWSAADLMNTINAGRNFIHHVGHANDSYVMKFSNWDITNANFAGVNGITHNFPVVSTHGCICGAFDVNDCIAEKMVSIENFAAVFIGNSRYGWFNEGQTEGPSAHLHREYVDAMFTDSLNRAGRAQVESKAATSPWVNAPGQWEEGALRWCFYDCNVLGDPALAIWTDEPISVSAAYPLSLTTGTPQFDVTVTNEGAPAKGLTAALLMNGILYGAGITASNGIATVVIDPLVIIPGDAQLVISGYNCLPTYFPLTFIAGETPYVVYQAHTLNDSQGNNNGQADFGETISLSITLQNIGLQPAENVMATISTDDSFVTFTDATESYGNIAAGGMASIENGFTFQLSEAVPDNHTISFTLTAVSGETWTSQFQLTAFAPLLAAGNAQVDDESGNGVPDPGETFGLDIALINSGHCNSLPVTATLGCNSTYISGTEWVANPVIINSQSQTTVNFAGIIASAQTPVGTTVSFTLTLTQGNPATVVLEKEYVFVVGQISEDFETGDFTHHAWIHGGNANWTITQTEPFEGLYCARSGQISDNQKSNLSIDYEVMADDSIRFCYKVSSESSYDFLRFYIDNIKVAEWSGESDWARAAFPVTSGAHNFKWAYEKDGSVIGGQDAAWIDEIIFPPVDINTSSGNDENFIPGLIVYPNPASGFISIAGIMKGQTFDLTISDLSGKIVNTMNGINETELMTVDVSGIKPGLYFIKLNNSKFSETIKLIIK